MKSVRTHVPIRRVAAVVFDPRIIHGASTLTPELMEDAIAVHDSKKPIVQAETTLRFLSHQIHFDGTVHLAPKLKVIAAQKSAQTIRQSLCKMPHETL